MAWLLVRLVLQRARAPPPPVRTLLTDSTNCNAAATPGKPETAYAQLQPHRANTLEESIRRAQTLDDQYGFRQRFRTYSVEGLIWTFNRDVGVHAWGSARAAHVLALRDALLASGLDCSSFISATHMMMDHKLKREGNAIVKDSSPETDPNRPPVRNVMMPGKEAATPEGVIKIFEALHGRAMMPEERAAAIAYCKANGMPGDSSGTHPTEEEK